jgi:hypothetical protein
MLPNSDSSLSASDHRGPMYVFSAAVKALFTALHCVRNHRLSAGRSVCAGDRFRFGGIVFRSSFVPFFSKYPFPRYVE